MEKPIRKHPRLKEYDYSECGCYYVTIQKQFGVPFFSTVGRGLAPAAKAKLYATGEETATVQLCPIGKEIERQLFALEKRFPNVYVDKYVIMPTHIHAIIFLTDAAGASPRPTLCDVVGALKSLTTRTCNQRDKTPGRKIFQTSFYDSVIDSDIGYQETWRYIDENPVK